MTYKRVIPRDLFNESKLMVCVGKVYIALERGFKPPITMEHEHSEHGFEVCQDQTDGSLFIKNISFSVFSTGEPITHYLPYNSRLKCPLMFSMPDGQDIKVFEDDNGGGFSEDLKLWFEEHT